MRTIKKVQQLRLTSHYPRDEWFPARIRGARMGGTKVGWPDHYRPDDLEGMALAPELRKRFKRYLAGDELPRSLILCGPPGFGKTTIARIIANRLYRDKGRSVKSVKSTETGNVDYIRNRVIEFMRSIMFGDGIKLLIFEEASGLSREGQETLRGPLEDFADVCRAIFITNNVLKLDPAIRSRCDEINLTRPPIQECGRILGQVLDAEGVTADPRTVLEFASSYFAAGSEDMRQFLAHAQHCIETQGALPVPVPPEAARGGGLFSYLE